MDANIIQFGIGQEIIEVNHYVLNVKDLLIEYKKAKGNKFCFDTDLRDHDLNIMSLNEYVLLEYTGLYSGLFIIIKTRPSAINPNKEFNGKDVDRKPDKTNVYPYIYKIANLGESSHLLCCDNGYIHFENRDFGIIDFFVANTGRFYYLSSENLDSVDMILVGEGEDSEKHPKQKSENNIVDDIDDLFDSFSDCNFDSDADWEWSIYNDKAVAINERMKMKCTLLLEEKMINTILVEYL
jgi:hypothetical protein